MPTTIIGPTSQEFPKRTYPTVVEVKPIWSDEWQFTPELQMVEASVCSSGQDLGRCSLRRRYGKVKLPWENDSSIKPAWGDSFGWWVRVRMVGDQGLQPIWIGQISNDTREVHGCSSHGPSGVQTYVAYGPAQILRKISVSRSYWDVDDVETDIGWVPNVNDRGDRDWMRGNRSEEKHGETYLYGGKEIWSHYDYAEYVLKRFVDESDAGGPKWRLAGQADILKDMSESIPMSTTQTVAEILRRLIPVRFGIDYTVFADDEGFVVWVYALSSLDFSYADKTLSRNPNTVQVKVGQTIDNIRTRIVKSNDHGYKKVRILGNRIVVCCSLCGSEVEYPHGGSLHEQWTVQLEAEYKAGTGDPGDPPEAHDAVRGQDKFRPVYQQFGAPGDWNFNDGQATVKLDAAGKLLPEAAEYQSAVHETLSWLPLREGFDYRPVDAGDWPVDNNPADVEPNFRPPIVWIGHISPYGGAEWAPDYFTPVEKFGIGVSVSRTDLGVFLSASPNHLLANEGHWDFATGATAFQPSFDYRKLAATIAFHSDQRMVFELELPDASPLGGVLDVEVDDAEFWYLAPHTIVGIEYDPEKTSCLITSGVEGRVLRDDSDRLGLVMAGVISRYYTGRTRADIVAKGHLPWGLLVGQILTMVEDGGSVQTMQAPITAVIWQTTDDGDTSTTIKAGFAG